jgi:dTDP-glucose 4,6-dehydratase
MSYSPRNVLITGGAGFIGANFVRHWLARGQDGRVVVLDALTYAGNRENLAGLESDPHFLFVHGDICDEAAVKALIEQQSIDTVVHFAAESHVDRSILGPDEFIRTNILGTHSLLKAVKNLWLERQLVPAHRFHHVSTDEACPYAPNSPYSASKASSDHLVRAYHETYGLATTVTNCSNNYGPYQFPEKLIPLIIINILAGEPLPVYGDGRQIRDWLHVGDHCEAIELALERGRPGAVYNIGGNAETANIDIVRRLCALLDARFGADAVARAAYPRCPPANGRAAAELITHVRDRAGHDRRYAINFGKAKRELGYAPARDLSGGLAATLDWYLSNVGWWQQLLGRDYAEWIAKNYGQ